MAQKHLVENLSADIMNTSQALLVPTLPTSPSLQQQHQIILHPGPGSPRQDLDMRAVTCLFSWTASV